jgi:hypothetical protein
MRGSFIMVRTGKQLHPIWQPVHANSRTILLSRGPSDPGDPMEFVMA